MPPAASRTSPPTRSEIDRRCGGLDRPPRRFERCGCGDDAQQGPGHGGVGQRDFDRWHRGASSAGSTSGQRADDYVRESPWAAVGLAALVAPWSAYWSRDALKGQSPCGCCGHCRKRRLRCCAIWARISNSLRSIWSGPNARRPRDRRLRARRRRSVVRLGYGMRAVIAVTWTRRTACLRSHGWAEDFLRSRSSHDLPLKIRRGRAPFLDSVRREWKEDSVILERILADEDQ